MSAASGRCGNATAHFSNATCNGGDDSAALADWISYAHGLGAVRAVLFIPPGCTEGAFGGDGNSSFSADITVNCAGFGAQPVTTVQQPVIWGYGTFFPQLWFGGQGFFGAQNTQGVETGCGSGPTNTSPLIQAANAGDTTVTLVTAGDSSNLTVGDWIAVTALANQGTGSFPPNHSFHEHKLITAINGGTGVITLNAPLLFSYKTTYPNLGGTQPFEGGPATIYLMEKTYNNISQYFGMTITGTNQSNILGRSVVLQDVTWLNPASTGPNPTQSEAIWLIGNRYPASEVDKEIDLLAVINSSVGNTDVQSAAVNNLIIQGTTFSGALNGVPANAVISNSKFSAIRAGPTCCGHGNSIALDGVTFVTALQNFHHSAISAYSFSAGTLTIAKTASEWTSGAAPGLWVPGMKYFMGDTDGSNTCAPANTFTVSDVVDAGANVQIVTNISSIPVTNICNANTRPPSTFGAYQAMSLTQKFSGPGNLLSNPEMLPP